jgi:hypothetical protein
LFLDLQTWRTLSRGTGGVATIDAAVRAIRAQ